MVKKCKHSYIITFNNQVISKEVKTGHCPETFEQYFPTSFYEYRHHKKSCRGLQTCRRWAHLAPIRAAPLGRKFDSRLLPKSILLVWRLVFNSLTFFQFSTNLCALPVRDVTRTPSPVSSRTIDI